MTGDLSVIREPPLKVLSDFGKLRLVVGGIGINLRKSCRKSIYGTFSVHVVLQTIKNQSFTGRRERFKPKATYAHKFTGRKEAIHVSSLLLLEPRVYWRSPSCTPSCTPFCTPSWAPVAAAAHFKNDKTSYEFFIIPPNVRAAKFNKYFL